MRRILLTSRLPFSLENTVINNPNYQVTLAYNEPLENGEDHNAKLRRLAIGQEGILCTINDRIDKELLEACHSTLSVVSTLSVGLDHIDLEACRAMGTFSVGHTPQVLNPAMAELAIALVLNLLRFIPANVEFARTQWGASSTGGSMNWDPNLRLGGQIYGSVVAIVGMGRIGRDIMERILPFQPSEIIGYVRKLTPSHRNSDTNVLRYSDNLQETLSQADIVIVALSLNEETVHFFNHKVLSQFIKEGSILVNIARGPIIHTDALVEALRSGRLAGVALDVTDPEPLPPAHPLFTEFDSNRVIVVPHIGSATKEARQAMAMLSIRNLEQGLKGEPLLYSAI